jgi:hypothetical protein
VIGTVGRDCIISKLFIPPSKSGSLTSNPPSVLPVPLRRFYQPVNQFLNQPIPLQTSSLPHINRLLALLTIPVSSYLPEKLSMSWSEASHSLPTLASRQF